VSVSTGRDDRNRGLTNAEAEILRRVNLGLDKTTMSYAHYRDRLRRPVIEELGRLHVRFALFDGHLPCGLTSQDWSVHVNE
jgi:hypothetical protein